MILVGPGVSGTDEGSGLTGDISAVTADSINKSLAKTGDVYGLSLILLSLFVASGILAVVYSRKKMQN